MALRISAKRATALLKARNVASAFNCILKRNTSHAAESEPISLPANPSSVAKQTTLQVPDSWKGQPIEAKMKAAEALVQKYMDEYGFLDLDPMTSPVPCVERCQILEIVVALRKAQAEAYKEEPTPSCILNPDPAADSVTTALVNEQEPYMVKTYVRPPPVFVTGEGCYLYDKDSRQYLDFTAGIAVNALGHCNDKIAEIIADQSKRLVHTSNLYNNEWTGALSELLVKKTIERGGMHNAQSVFICNSGTEANEAAIKFARKTGKVLDPSGAKHEIVSFHNSFHGRTMGALSATPNPKYQKPFAPMLPGFRYGTYNDVEGIEDLVTENTCGVIVEPIQGEGGVIVGTEEFLCALAHRCHEVGAVLIYDEIQCGLSRTGTFWAHASLPESAHPDIITTAKALGNGFPIGATIVNKDVSEKIVVGDHGTTFGGNPLGCRIAAYVVNKLSSPDMLEWVENRGETFTEELENLEEEFPELITEIRGEGLHLGLQLSRDPSPFVAAARERGLLILTAGHNTLRFVPSLTITDEEIEKGCRILFNAITAVLSGEEEAAQAKKLVEGEVDSPN